MALDDRPNIIVAETHRAFDDEIKQAIRARCLSCTFLPHFATGVNAPVRDMDTVFARISNIDALRYDGISKYEIEQKAKKSYNGDIVSLVKALDMGSAVFLAQDNDAGGNMMASVLYHKLIDAGIEPDRLIRVIGLEKVIRGESRGVDLYVGEFIDRPTLLRLLDRARIERKIIYETRRFNGHLAKGIRNIASLYATITGMMSDTYVERKSEGVALATYLTKWCLDEKGTEDGKKTSQ